MIEPARAAVARLPWGVAALLLAAGDTLGQRFGALLVQGELSGFTRAASGHCYFNLKDAEGHAASLRCALFRRAASQLEFAPADGQRVEIRGRLAIYEPRGELQFVAESMQRQGSGSLYEQFLRLRARLQADGLFDPERKRRPASLPRHLGIVTSLQAAALHDVLSSMARRAPQVGIVVYPSPVQGAEAPAALVRAIELAGTRAEVDTLLLVRGGGSLEDLWAFNDERVVRAVAACPLPVVCGVGHETDVTLCDLAADLRAPTPTAAAELATAAQADELARLTELQRRLRQAWQRRLDGLAQRLDQQAMRLGRPARALAQQQQALMRLAQRLRASLQQRQAQQALPSWAGRLQRALAVRLASQRQQLDAHGRRLAALDPKQVLARGYAWVESADGRPLTSVRSLQPGQTVQGVWADGRADLQVRAVRGGKT